MKRPKKRLRKKYFKILISEVSCDVSQSDILRKRFFEANEDEVFDLSDSDLVPLLHVSSMTKIRKYRLRFTVAVVSKFGDFFAEKEFVCVVLLFLAKDFPGVFSESTIFKNYQEPS
ncbi:MAG: hypothetical protein FWH27_07535 [Planctomycetaceae bacterium]|nr:hypothetical protein [Planctomycetaceae bacterium]